MQFNIFTTLKWSLVVLLIAGLSACGGGGGGSDDDHDDGGYDSVPDNSGGNDQFPNPDSDPAADLAKRIHKLGIAGAQGFVITGPNGEAGNGVQKPAARKANALEMQKPVADVEQALQSDTLYKVTEGGLLQPVSFNDKAGNELERGAFRPLSIVEVGPDFVYMVIAVDTNWGSSEQVGLLINKGTGLAFLAGDALGDPYNFIGNDTRTLSSRFRFDNQGNIYLLRWHSDLGYLSLPTKVDISNLGYGDLTSAALQTLHDTSAFEVSGSGELMAYVGTNANGDKGYYVYDATTGGTPRLGTLNGPSETDLSNLFLGLDGELYITAGKNLWSYGAGGGIETLYQLKKNAGNIAAAEVGPVTHKSTSGAAEFNKLSFAGWDSARTRNVVNGLLIYTPNASIYSKDFYEVDLQNRVIVNHDLAMEDFDAGKSLKFYATGRHLWIHGSDESTSAPLVVRYNPVTKKQDTLTFNVNFELHRIEPVGEDRVMFEGVQLTGSNGSTKIVGQMDAQGNVLEQTIYAITKAPVTVLHAITPADFINIDGSPNDWDVNLRVLEGVKTSGVGGNDLLSYSETRGRGDYYGLVEFNGSISANHNHYTRIVFDTHTITIGSNSIWVTKGNEAPVDAIALGGSVAQGQAQEFAIPAALLGDGASPVLKSVQRFTAAIEDSADDWTYEWVDVSGNADYELRISVFLKAPLNGSKLSIALTDGYELIVTESGYTLADLESGTPNKVYVGTFTGTALTLEVPAADFDRSTNPTAITLKEKILYELQ